MDGGKNGYAAKYAMPGQIKATGRTVTALWNSLEATESCVSELAGI